MKRDSMATRWLRNHPSPGFAALLGLSFQAQKAVTEEYTFPDGSLLRIVENGPDKEYTAFGVPE
ncbi:MAG: hypothetical protein OXB97_08580 [Rhodospirillales bacterium]|nr:hypothetical protein [Rhodospirillales bacterium]